MFSDCWIRSASETRCRLRIVRKSNLTANGRSNSSKMRRRANNNFATSRRGCPLAERGEYIPSSRPYQGLPDLEYPFHDRYVLVTALRPDLQLPKEINIPTVLAGQRLGIKEVDEGIWLVSFIDHDLGDIDLEQRTLQPSTTRLEPGLSPMS